jgi:hypothetical protein
MLSADSLRAHTASYPPRAPPPARQVGRYDDDPRSAAPPPRSSGPPPSAAPAYERGLPRSRISDSRYESTRAGPPGGYSSQAGGRSAAAYDSYPPARAAEPGYQAQGADRGSRYEGYADEDRRVPAAARGFSSTPYESGYRGDDRIRGDVDSRGYASAGARAPVSSSSSRVVVLGERASSPPARYPAAEPPPRSWGRDSYPAPKQGYDEYSARNTSEDRYADQYDRSKRPAQGYAASEYPRGGEYAKNGARSEYPRSEQDYAGAPGGIICVYIYMYIYIYIYAVEKMQYECMLTWPCSDKDLFSDWYEVDAAHFNYCSLVLILIITSVSVRQNRSSSL